MKRFIRLLLVILSVLPISRAQTNRYDSGTVAVTTSLTAVIATTLILRILHCLNTTAGDVTLQITDGNDVEKFPPVTMAANSVLVGNWGDGIRFESGMKWVAGSNSAISCQVQGMR